MNFTAAEKALHRLAKQARRRARCPYSGFAVGAAIEAENGVLFAGCNIENASYGLTLCAERVALAKAISEGADEFARLAIVADTDQPTPPCGACRQLLWEYGGDLEILVGNLDGLKSRYRLADLFPFPFDARLL